MTGANLYMVIIAALFAIYGVACSLESALALRIARGEAKPKALFSPLWEAANVFLVLGIAGLAMTYSHALSSMGHAVLLSFGIGVVALLFRLCLGLVIFYGKDKASQAVAIIFALASLIAPLSFAAAGIYLLTGQQFYQSLVGLVLELSALFGLISVGLTLTDKLTGEDLAITELSYLLWLICLGSFVPLAVQHTGSLLQTLPIATLTSLSFLGMCLVLGKYSFGLKRTWLYIPVFAFLAPVVLAWANQPYLISGKLKLSDAYSGHNGSAIFLISVAIVFTAVVLRVGQYIRSPVPAKKSKPNHNPDIKRHKA